MNKSIVTTIIVSLVTFFSTQAQPLSLPEKLKTHLTINKFQGKHLPIQKHRNAAAKPTGNELELIAYTFEEYYDSIYSFNGYDSVRLYWHDSAGAGFDLIDYYNIYPDYSQPKKSPLAELENWHLSVKIDSAFYYEYDDTASKFHEQAYGKEGMEMYLDGKIHYHSFLYFEDPDFIEDRVYEYVYDNNDRLIERIHWNKDGMNFDLIGKDSFSYDSSGNLIYEALLEEMGGNVFSIYSEIIHTYTGSGLLTGTAETYRNSITSALDTIRMTHYSYTTNNDLSIEIRRNDIGSGLAYNYMKVYNYSGNQLTDIIAYDWKTATNSWDTSVKIEFEYVFSSIPEVITEYSYNSPDWTESIQHHHFYNSNNDLDSSIFYMNEGSGLEKSSITYYNRNNEGLIEILELKSHWDVNDSIWKNDNGDFKINMYYDTIQVDTTNNIRTIENTVTEINIYPNPTNNILNIFSEKENIESVSIFDNNGRILKHYIFNKKQTNQTLNIGQYSSGLYTLMIVANGKKTVKKVVVQH